MKGATKREEVTRQLRNVAEPCSSTMGWPVDLCETGLFEGIQFQEGYVRITPCLNDPVCTHLASMRRFITDQRMQLEAILSMEIRQTVTELWTPERIGRGPLER